MRCNSCWKEVENSELYVVVKCKHVFCEECAQKAWMGGNYKCPLCGVMLTEDDISRNDFGDVETLSKPLFGVPQTKLNEIVEMLSSFNNKQVKLNEFKIQHDAKMAEKKANARIQQIMAKAFEYRKQRDRFKEEANEYKVQAERLELENKRLKNLIQEYEDEKKQTKEMVFRLQQENSDNSNAFGASKFFEPKQNKLPFIEKRSPTVILPKESECVSDKFAVLKKNRESNKNVEPIKNIFAIKKPKPSILQSPAVNRRAPIFTSPLRSVVIPFTPI
ncbi:hypothetical protein EIN_425050 [Entamoeba invadens IP1]|uniref:RING-type domain-containing protein n=1 Tax=Entamoeba invadens IP1 TaxID=370355 RepID=A0A0A1U5X2_ENTIV|nr:hypothetical protein EIN_425050 [Entamoeba invadens IP1]ELP89783.1 hypothetical protein EIN_425050 [Entamoeba invadens IP1]|eukprot:XP_004256554.1 hypothetical protein EIN_425050 [Entamoeba invadens IP1]